MGRLGGFGRDSSSALGRLGSFGRGSSSALGRLGGFGRDSSSALGRLGGFGSSSALGGAAHIQQPVTATIFTPSRGETTSGTSCKHVQLLCSQGVLSRAGDSQGKKLKNDFGASCRLGGFGSGSSSALGRLGGFGRGSSSALGRLGGLGRGSSSALGRLGSFGSGSSSALGRLGGFGALGRLGRLGGFGTLGRLGGLGKGSSSALGRAARCSSRSWRQPSPGRREATGGTSCKDVQLLVLAGCTEQSG